MKYCKKCGHEIKESNKFCEKCGTPVETTQPNVEKIQEKYEVKKEEKPKKVVDEKTRKKRLILGILALIIIILGFTGYKVGESLTSPDKVVEQFISAISNKDTETIVKMLKSTDRRMEITKENIKPFMDYLDENPSYYDKLSNSLLEQSNKKVIPAYSQDENRNKDKNIISLKKKGKKYLIYDNYEIVMQPYFLKIGTNNGNTKIFINDEEVDKSVDDYYLKEFGPFVPGKYTVKVEYEGDYATLESKADLYLISDNYDSNNKVITCNLDIYMTYASIDSNYYDSNVLINGEDTGLTVAEVNEMGGIGPLASNTIMQIKREFPWGTIESEEVFAGDWDYVELYLDPINENLQEDIMEAVNTFLYDEVQALTARDPHKFTNLAEPELSRKLDIIDNMIYWEELYKGNLLSAVYDLDSLLVYYDYDGSYYAQINCMSFYERTYYYEGDEPGDLMVENNSRGYYLNYDAVSKKWIIYDSNYNYYFDENNTRTFEFNK